MLKIKNNVDLKELEKYGFIFLSNRGIWRYRTETHYVSITINCWDRIIKTSNATKYLGCIYDLIKDGLVEKV